MLTNNKAIIIYWVTMYLLPEIIVFVYTFFIYNFFIYNFLSTI